MAIVCVLREIDLVHAPLPGLNEHQRIGETRYSTVFDLPPITSTNSEPAIERNGTPASAATAFANNVLPIPGGPRSNAPFGIFAPKFYILIIIDLDFFRISSCLPQTSLEISCIRRIPSLLVSLLSFRPHHERKSSVCSLWCADQPWWISLWSISSND